MTFEVADLAIALRHDESVVLRLPSEISGFCSDRVDPDVDIEVSLADLRQPPGGEKLFDSGGLWQLYNEAGALVWWFTTPSLGRLPYKRATFRPDLARGQIHLHHGYFDNVKPVYPLEYPLYELLMVNMLAAGRGAEIHACGIVDIEGNGHLFVGHSRAGKSTTAALWRAAGMTILSDDRIILRKQEGRFYMYGTPWHGEARFASQERVLLSQVFFIAHGKQNEVLDVSTAAAVARLFSASFVPYHNKAGIEFTLGFYDELVRNVPCYEYQFVPDHRSVEFIRERKIEPRIRASKTILAAQ